MDDKDYGNYLGLKWTKVAAGYALWTASSGAGDTIPAGLPDITGTIGGDSIRLFATTSRSGAFSTSTTATYTNWGNGANSGTKIDKVNFKASSSNSIYGKSTTVQPPAIKICMWLRTN